MLVLLGLLVVGVLGLRALDDALFEGGQTSSTPPPPTPVRTVRLLVPEGYAIRDIVHKVPTIGLSRRSYRAAIAAAHPPAGYRATGKERLGMEGFLFPATYELTRPVSGKVLVAEQLAAFRRETAGVDFRYAAKHGLTRYDVLIIASMIEREAAAPVDRAKISAVIYNRLHDNQALGIDATSQYAAGSWAPITERDLQSNTPYNTRRFKGLPPTPICNPGLASMQAAAAPKKVDYLYYVAQPGKAAQYFTKDYQDFLNHGG